MKNTRKTAGIIIRATLTMAAPATLLIWSCSDPGTTVPGGNAPTVTWKMPAEVYDTTQHDYAVMGWQSFIALSWPADLSYRGKPDTTKSIGADGTRVWETFRLKEETFLANAQRPDSWNGTGTTGLSARNLAEKTLYRYAKNFDTIPFDPDGGGEFNQAGSNSPLIDQDSNYVMYEIGINESEYDYILNHRYYDGNVQRAQVHAHTFVNPPKGDTLVHRSGDSLVYQIAPSVAMLPVFAQYGATEFKASWRILPVQNKAIWNRYYHRPATIALPQGGYETQEVGLVGLHILRLTALTGSTWYWATFEQVDNVTPPDAGVSPSFNPGGNPSYPNGFCYVPENCDSLPPPIDTSLPPNPRPVNVSRFTPIPTYVDSLNNTYQELLAGTVWQYYEMVGVVNPALHGNTQYPMNNATGIYTNVDMMANVTMETYKQNESFSPNVNFSNCVGCHSFGTPLTFNNAADQAYALAEYQIFTFLLDDADTVPAGSTGQVLTPKEAAMLVSNNKRKKMR